MVMNCDELLGILKKEIIPATGCTEPIAVAYSTAVARSKAESEIVDAEIYVDPGLYKNGMKVGIPGTSERGLKIAAALGIVAGNPEMGLRVIENISEDDVKKAKHLVDKQKITIHIRDGCQKLYIETILHTKHDNIRVITKDRHMNIVSEEKGINFKQYDCDNKANPSSLDIQDYDLEDFINFSNEVPLSDIMFLSEGVKMNLSLADEGINLPSGIGHNLEMLHQEGLIGEGPIFRSELLCSSASEARMSGSRLPSMTSAGSGNHGITIFLTCYAAARYLKTSDEKLLRALALSNLITFYIKSYTGTLSAMCGCGVAAGIGTSAGLAYLMGGGVEQIMGSMINMVGSISGLICDGGKEGCAYKLALSSGWAVQSALLALKGSVINTSNGILSPDFKQMFKNLGYICNPGMVDTNCAIVKVMSMQ